MPFMALLMPRVVGEVVVEAEVEVEAEEMDEPVIELAKDGPRGLVIAMGIELSLEGTRKYM